MKEITPSVFVKIIPLFLTCFSHDSFSGNSTHVEWVKVESLSPSTEKVYFRINYVYMDTGLYMPLNCINQGYPVCVLNFNTDATSTSLSGSPGMVFNDYYSLNKFLSDKYSGRVFSSWQYKGNKCLSIGFASTSSGGQKIIGNTCDGTLPPLPPTIPTLVCHINMPDNVIDFGSRTFYDVEGQEKGLWVNVSCQGKEGESGTGRLTFAGMSGSDEAEMKLIGGRDTIKVKLIASKVNNSNTLMFTAKNGFVDQYQVMAKIMSFNITNYGKYMGQAVVKVTID